MINTQFVEVLFESPPSC
jgi:hypothetical protein